MQLNHLHATRKVTTVENGALSTQSEPGAFSTSRARPHLVGWSCRGTKRAEAFGRWGGEGVAFFGFLL